MQGQDPQSIAIGQNPFFLPHFYNHEAKRYGEIKEENLTMDRKPTRESQGNFHVNQ